MYNSPWVTISYVFCAASVVLYVIFTIVVTIGGALDLVFMFRQLKTEVVDERDDGRVVEE
jgi:hypothetical protein